MHTCPVGGPGARWVGKWEFTASSHPRAILSQVRFQDVHGTKFPLFQAMGTMAGG